jgi:hypothetical protein
MTEHTFRVSGAIQADYLDPNLGTEMALVMEPFYNGKQRNGSGWCYWYARVPESVVIDLIEDMDIVAWCRASGDAAERKVGRAMDECLVRLRKMVDGVATDG